MPGLSCELIARKILGEPHHISAGELYYLCPQHADVHPSLKINPRKNVFLCGPCAASGGAWGFAAWLARVGANEKKAVGAWLREHGFEQAKEPATKKEKPERSAFREVAFYNYTPVLRNVRFEAPAKEGEKPEKTFQFQHFEKGVWKPGGAGMPKPLYVNQCFRDADQIDFAVGFEGEAKCDLADTLNLPGFSYKYMTTAECAKLAGIEVILWPDADQAGIKQAKMAAELLHTSRAPRLIRICSLPLELPVSGDIVDAVKILGWTREEMDRLFAEAIAYPEPPKPIGKRFSQITEATPEWLWQNRIPRGAFSMLDGDPGTGKSMLALEIAARVSRGEPLPDNGQHHKAASVILLSSEDSLSHTLAPRLRMAGADLTKIIAIPYSPEQPGDECFTRLPRDLKILRRAIEQESAALVIIDVLVSYIPAELSTQNDQAVRLALAPLTELGEITGASFLATRHLNKNTGASAMYRGGGSIGISGAARCSMLLARDPSDPDTRVLAVIKSNMGIIPQSVNMTIASVNGVPRIVWGENSRHDAESLLAETGTRRDAEDTSALARAKKFLIDALSNGPVQAEQIKKDARENSISVGTLRRAQDTLNIDCYKSSGYAGVWYWELKSKLRN